MEFLSEYGLFLAKVVTIVVAILVVVGFIVANRAHMKERQPGHISVSRLNDRYEEMKEVLLEAVMDGGEFAHRQKQMAKEKKAKEKALAKQRKAELKVAEKERKKAAKGQPDAPVRDRAHQPAQVVAGRAQYRVQHIAFGPFGPVPS